MPDTVSKEKRSWIMSRIRGRWTSPEKQLHGMLKSLKIKHKMHPRMEGTPDALVYPYTVIFVDGCFWHGCPRCYRPPKSKVEYWWPKIEANKKRDKKRRSLLRKQGWYVLRIWEHELSSGSRAWVQEVRGAMIRGRVTRRKKKGRAVQDATLCSCSKKTFRRAWRGHE